MQTCDQSALGWTVVLRRQPVRVVEGQIEGGYTDVFELICCDCGDHPDLDYRDISPEFQRIRGPYPIVVGVAAYGEHLEQHHKRAPGSPSPRRMWVRADDPQIAASGATERTGASDSQPEGREWLGGEPAATAESGIRAPVLAKGVIAGWPHLPRLR